MLYINRYLLSGRTIINGEIVEHKDFKENKLVGRVIETTGNIFFVGHDVDILQYIPSGPYLKNGMKKNRPFWMLKSERDGNIRNKELEKLLK